RADVVPLELPAARPERQSRALLELRVDDVAERHAAMGRADGVADQVLLVPDDEDGFVHARGPEPVQKTRQETPALKFDQSLGPLVSERGQALAHASGQDESGHGFGPLVVESSNWSSSCLVLSRWTRSG